MQIAAKRIKRILRRLVKVFAVLVNTIVGGEIKAAAKPPYRILIWRLRNKTAHIHMGGGRFWIARMKHQGDTHGLKTPTCHLRTILGGSAGHFVTTDM